MVVVRLPITSPISWSRSASVLVSDAVLASSPCTVPPSPWSTWTRFMLSSLTCSGGSASKSGLKPSKSVVRSSDGEVWSTGSVAPASSRVPVLGLDARGVPADPGVEPVGRASPGRVPATSAR